LSHIYATTVARQRSQRLRSALRRLLELLVATASRRSEQYGPAQQVSASRVAERVEEQKKCFCSLRRHHGDVKNHVKYHGPRPPYHSAGGTPGGLRRQPEAAWGIPLIPQRDIFLSVFHVAVLTPQSGLYLLKTRFSIIETAPAASPRAIYLSARPPRLIPEKMSEPQAANPHLRKFVTKSSLCRANALHPPSGHKSLSRPTPSKFSLSLQDNRERK